MKDGRIRYVERMLSVYKEMIMDTLLSDLPDIEPRRYLYDLLPQYPLRSGKGLRPALCLATCGAFGGAVDHAVPSAVSIELFHNAFLVHDDVEDGSDNRRGQPTLNSEYGPAIAVNVGDALNVMSIRPLMLNNDCLGPVLTWKIFTEIEHMVRRSVEGQAMELGWIHDNICTLTEADYLQMILKKTCWYTCIHPCRIGGLIATQGVVDADRFNRFGYYVGAAFQIQDDLLNLTGDESRYGKEIGGDIWEGKRTLMLIHALNNCTKNEKQKMRSFLKKPRLQRRRDEVEWVYGIMHKYGSIGYARSCARQLTGAAYREFSVAYGDLPETVHKQFVKNLIFYMIDRDL
jgi:geranylgeranyl diphosphate synthase type II